MKRILVVGVSSLIGTHLAIALRKRHCVYGTYASHKPGLDHVVAYRFPLIRGAPIGELVRFLKPDAVFYCAGDADEAHCLRRPSETHFVNCEGALHFSEALRSSEKPFFFFSSSKVFSGEQGGYAEEDPTSPTTLYGHAKREAEQGLENHPGALTLRLGNVFGLGPVPQRSALNRLLEALWRKQPLELICDEYRSFYGVENVVSACQYFLDLDPFPAGLFQLSHGREDSHYSFGVAVAEALGLPSDALHPVSGERFSASHGTPSPRGRGANLTLSGDRLAEEHGIRAAPLKASLLQLRERLAQGGF